ncbi:MAG TPA: lantibiotic dehydratase C-terminal domain-containing protein [Longimicrobium sp.]|nr:lantibiotic dehydratase C-terminal domain-containing protein [Longimicrobium sp.]
MRPPDPGAWRAWHLFYHGDRDRLLSELVRPLAAALWAEGEATGFYAVRYGLGGPHVRLRLRPAPGRAGAVGERVVRAAEAFYSRAPSTAPMDDEAVRRLNRSIAPSDPLAAGLEDVVHPDNSVLEAPVVFEVERYGGPARFGHALDFFALSSAATLRFLAAHAGDSAGRRLTHVFRLIAGVAWGLAEDGDDFTGLVGYAVRFFSATPLAGLSPHGDAAFERNRDAYVRCLRAELAALAAGEGIDAPPSPRALAGAARALAREIALPGGDAGAEWRIRAGQLHMTANRLGLLNPDEFYLCHLLARAARALAEDDPAFWRDLWEAHAGRPPAGPPLRDRVAPAMAGLLTLSPDVATEAAAHAG